MEYRTIQSEVRSADGAEPTVDGIGIVYDKEVEIFPGFREVIRKGAFKVDPKREIKSFFNHDPKYVLSTTRSDPALVLEETDKGLRFVSPIPPTSYGNDLVINLKRGNVRGASFTFTIDEDGQKITEDKNGVWHREITKGTLYEIGPVTDPMYPTSKSKLRSKEDILAEYRRSSMSGENELDLLKKILFNLEA
jgi:HK97 family phage prohead protease